MLNFAASTELKWEKNINAKENNEKMSGFLQHFNIWLGIVKAVLKPSKYAPF